MKKIGLFYFLESVIFLYKHHPLGQCNAACFHHNVVENCFSTGVIIYWIIFGGCLDPNKCGYIFLLELKKLSSSAVTEDVASLAGTI